MMMSKVNTAEIPFGSIQSQVDIVLDGDNKRLSEAQYEHLFGSTVDIESSDEEDIQECHNDQISGMTVGQKRGCSRQSRAPSKWKDFVM